MIHTAQMQKLVIAITLASGLATPDIGLAQMPTDPMNTMPGTMPGPMPGTMPGSMGGMPDPMAGMLPQPSGKTSLKQIFAGTLGLVLQTTGISAASALSQALGGAIQSWFTRPNKPAQPDPAMAMNGMPAGTGMNTMPPAAPGMGGMDMSTAPDPMAGTGMPPPSLYAGIAFEVHALGLDGSSVPVDPATRAFATGERFVVFYRPSLPGQVRVMNVNPLGQEKQIDSVAVAAGELARLGPYEFRDTTGEEILRLILVSCRTDALLATTRDIVKVADVPPPAAAAPGIPGLSECTQASTRGDRPQTRDIAKVETEDGTMFALDPVTQQEISSGRITPREVTIRFRHL